MFLNRKLLAEKIPVAWRLFLKKLYRGILGMVYRHDLVKLAILFRTDKWDGHWYITQYQKYFSALRHKKLNLFEIGVGGYENPNGGGRSLRMWKFYFPNSQIYSIDIYDKKNYKKIG